MTKEAGSGGKRDRIRRQKEADLGDKKGRMRIQKRQDEETKETGSGD